jgi:DNA-binding CsgD family transcriptional regulator
VIASFSDGDGRAVKQRARYLDRTSDLRRREALALAWRERGWSLGGIAKQIDASEGTVAEYMDRVTARYGVRATFTKTADERNDLETVDAEAVAGWPQHFQARWLKCAREHRGLVPADAETSEEL